MEEECSFIPFQKNERSIKIIKNERFLKVKKRNQICYYVFNFIIIIILIFLFLLYLIFNLQKSILKINNININLNSTKNNNISKQTKVCVCTPAKEENRYIREFIQHYEKYGVDKMFLYDNNEIEGEKFDDILKDYISKGFVEVLNWRGKKNCMYEIMNDCYRNNYEKYDWLIFYEVDEFIHLTNYSNVKDFLNEKKFEKCEIIQLNLICHTDNNLLYYENKPLAERFPEITPRNKLGGHQLEIKNIIRGNLSKVVITNIHRGDENLKNCNGFGHTNSLKSIYAFENDDKYYYIDHYYSKSTEEFIEKLIKNDLVHTSDKYKIFRIRKYFAQSQITKEKLDFIENRTRLNLKEFRTITDIKYIPLDF